MHQHLLYCTIFTAKRKGKQKAGEGEAYYNLQIAAISPILLLHFLFFQI
ncbi:hypothetical protein HMPREF9383_2095 [Streptococcus sanguinis SK150]|uniref:Uncharacterized protein n=1 Tax=Streptococcus sanguinis SK150 TaxID=888811 RepID=F0IQ19_STRSA|nr:hypothetical protein HMPREF9383_2095 [Streptococcus sanguinis SK150]